MEKFTDGLKSSYAAEVAILRQRTVTVSVASLKVSIAIVRRARTMEIING